MRRLRQYLVIATFLMTVAACSGEGQSPKPQRPTSAAPAPTRASAFCLDLGLLQLAITVFRGQAGPAETTARNLREVEHDPTAHAEVVALRAAAASLGSWNLEGCTLVVTLEPCVMCAGAVLQSRVSRLVFGAWDEKAGAAGSMYDVVRDRRLPYRAEVVAGVREGEASALLRAFFDARR